MINVKQRKLTVYFIFVPKQFTKNNYFRQPPIYRHQTWNMHTNKRKRRTEHVWECPSLTLSFDSCIQAQEQKVKICWNDRYD